MKKEDIKIGLKVRYDDEIVTIKEYFPQIKNTSPSGDIIVIDKDGFEELVNHNDLELLGKELSEELNKIDEFFDKMTIEELEEMLIRNGIDKKEYE